MRAVGRHAGNAILVHTVTTNGVERIRQRFARRCGHRDRPDGPHLRHLRSRLPGDAAFVMHAIRWYADLDDETIERGNSASE
jgi:hypothetical protein